MNAVAKSIPRLEIGVVTQVVIDAIAEDGGQPRRSFDQAELAALTESVKERGVMQPLLVRYDDNGKLFILDGARRLRAAKTVKLSTVPVMLVAQHESAEQLRVDQVAVNELRSRLSSLELGFLLRQLRDDMHNTPNQIAAHLQKNGLGALAKHEVDALIGLTELPAWAHKLVADQAIEPKALAPLVRFTKDRPKVVEAARATIEDAARWGGRATGHAVSQGVRNGLAKVGVDLTRTDSYQTNPVLFDWKSRCKGCEFLVQHGGGGFCMKPELFKQHQAEAKEAGLGPGGKRLRAAKDEDAGAGEHKPTAAEKREKSEQRTRSLGGKAEEYLHAYLIRALVPKIDTVADQLMLFVALKRPALYDRDDRGAPACHYPDGREMPVEKLGSRKAAQDHKVYALEVVIEKRTPKQRAAIVHSIALETLFELPFREVQVLAHHVLGDDISRIWKLEPAFLDLFRKPELVHLAKQHKVPLEKDGRNPETAKASELKMWILEHQQLMKAPKILVDLYAKIEKPDRHAFD